jgi:hypothetical protein
MMEGDFDQLCQLGQGLRKALIGKFILRGSRAVPEALNSALWAD